MVAINSNNLDPTDVPPPDVLQWCENLVRMLADGGVWGIPRSGTVFRVDKQRQRLICTSLGPDEDDSDFHATRHVFGFIGWDVLMETDDG